MNHKIFSFNVIHCLCILVLKLQGWFDVLLHHLMQALKLIEKTCLEGQNHGN